MPVANMIFSAENPHMCENPVAEMMGLNCSIKLLSKKWCGVDARLSLAFYENWFLLTYGHKFYESQKAKYICQIDEENMA